MRGMEALRKGDVIVIYRTSDDQGPAYYRSVATSICVLEEYRSIRSFDDRTDFLSYCRPFSVFSDDELERFWIEKKYPHIIRFTYNIALKKRPNRGALIEKVGLTTQARWGFMPLTIPQLLHIARLGQIHENLVVN